MVHGVTAAIMTRPRFSLQGEKNNSGNVSDRPEKNAGPASIVEYLLQTARLNYCITKYCFSRKAAAGEDPAAFRAH